MNEREMELRIDRMDLGVLVTNARAIREYVEAGLERYAGKRYDEDNLAEAKADRAALNKAAQVLNAKRIELERQWMKPFDEFKCEITDTVKSIKAASSVIDETVKKAEVDARNAKEAEIAGYYHRKGYAVYVGLDRIMEARWLNKSEKMQHIEAEIDGKVADVRRGLEAIEAMELEAAEEEDVKCRFLDTLDLQGTLRWRKERAETLARIAKEKAGREGREREMLDRAAAALKSNKGKETGDKGVGDHVKFLPMGAAAAAEAPILTSDPFPEGKSLIRFEVECTAVDAEVIAAFLTELGVTYKMEGAS